MKPKIFLSHNKNDKHFIKQLADALRPARIDVWYDDWEIPPGASLRTKIFEEGIPGCDLFFVYLTENSINSSWVKQELDAAFVTELEDKGGFLALYVNKDEIRDQLPLDLRSRRIPAINEDNISESLLELVALAWETFSKNQTKRVQDENRIVKLEKENEINKLRLETKEDYPSIIQTLENIVYESEESSMRDSLAKILFKLRRKLALGIFETDFARYIFPHRFSNDVKADLLLYRLIFYKESERTTSYNELEYPEETNLEKKYELTDLGKRVIFQLEKHFGK